ncbi:MAG: linear amide C-N hydrolase [Clostridia bacterium]|nr:linear amide C-N hydrolase [Clostridia bacterium]
MCTALSLLPDPSSASHLFGRTLDIERPYGAKVVVAPRRYPLRLRRAPAALSHYALIGAAVCQDGFPLYFEAANEHGLCMAGLNFPGFAAYHPPIEGRINLAPFELIPYVLGRCAAASQARALLEQVNVTDDAFSPDLPNTPLHWLIADARECFAAESMASGLVLTDDPARTLTNSPPLAHHLLRLADHMALTPAPPANHFAPAVPLEPYSYGMGALGLPGDLSSPSRFVRAVFLSRHSDCGDMPPVLQFLHLLESVAQLRGATRTQDGAFEYTHYMSCIDASSSVYHYRLYGSARVCAVRLHDHPLDGDALLAAPMVGDAAPLFTRAEPL